MTTDTQISNSSMLKDLQRVTLKFLRRSPDSLNLLQGFSRREFCVRVEWAQSVQRVIDSWYFGFGSPAVAGFLETYAQDRNGSTVDTSMHHNIYAQIPDLIRFTHTSPLLDVRIACQNILDDIEKKKKFPISALRQLSPSYCFNKEELPYLKCIFDQPIEDDPLFTSYALFIEYWYRWTRLDNFIQILGCHPEFLEPFMRVHQCLFTGDLSLPYSVRYYLAILAAAELRCPQLVCLFARFFLHAGGESSWLQGLSEGPSRWNQLCGLNSNLAHSPWKIGSEDIYQLTRGHKGNPGDKLSLSELMHAVAIMTHVHSLASFVCGAAVRPELEHIELPRSPDDAATNLSTAFISMKITGDPIAPRVGRQEYRDRGTAALELFNLLQSESSDEWDNHMEDEAVAEIFQSNAKCNAQLDLSGVCTPIVALDDLKMTKHPVIDRFVKSQADAAEDFAGAAFLVSEFSWVDAGCPLVEHLASSLGTLLDDAFQNAFDLTYNTLNEYINVNTSSFRHTLWYFVQSLFGVCHEDFCFDRVLKLLSLEQRAYLKVCATRPYELFAFAPNTCQAVFPALSTSEIIHILIMIMESRQQACISYALRAISQCQMLRE